MTTILQSASLHFCEDSRLLSNSTYCLQDKHNGRRFMVRKQGDTITGIIPCNGESSQGMRSIWLARASVFVQQRRSPPLNL